MGIAAYAAAVVENSRNGLLAAVGAGLRCVVTVSSFTHDEDFSESLPVVSSLGDPGSERATDLAHRANVPRDAEPSLRP